MAAQPLYAPKSATCIDRLAPPVITENSLYVAWLTNKTGIDEFLFRPPTDSGKTFGRQDQSSNITDADSSRV